MNAFISELKSRNETLFYFTAILLACAVMFFALAKLTTTQVAGVNAWYKPFKFSVSIAIYCGTMAWYCHYLPSFNAKAFSWINIALFTFEIVYISIQAFRGQESHFNLTPPLYTALFGGMALAAIVITLYAGYVGVLFFTTCFPDLPAYYVWAIRLSILIFIVFSFEGLAMGGRQTHTIGTEVQTTFLPLSKWNMREGDLRVAHFVGMHALQIIPLLSFYALKNTRTVFILSFLYLILSAFVLVQALQGKPFIKTKRTHHELIN